MILNNRFSYFVLGEIDDEDDDHSSKGLAGFLPPSNSNPNESNDDDLEEPIK